jgi:hypothetical protein
MAQAVEVTAVAVAVTMVETRFRPMPVRFLEYLCWWRLRRLQSMRAARMTLGRSQVRAVLLTKYLNERGKPVSLWEVIRTGENWNDATALAMSHLSTASDGRMSISERYTGRHNPYYEHCLAGC